MHRPDDLTPSHAEMAPRDDADPHTTESSAAAAEDAVASTVDVIDDPGPETADEPVTAGHSVETGTVETEIVAEAVTTAGSATTNTDAAPAVDIGAWEADFDLVDEALAKLDGGDLDGAEEIVSRLIGSDLVIDLTETATSDEPRPDEHHTDAPATSAGSLG